MKISKNLSMKILTLGIKQRIRETLYIYIYCLVKSRSRKIFKKPKIVYITNGEKHWVGISSIFGIHTIQ